MASYIPDSLPLNKYRIAPVTSLRNVADLIKASAPFTHTSGIQAHYVTSNGVHAYNVYAIQKDGKLKTILSKSATRTAYYGDASSRDYETRVASSMVLQAMPRLA